jgi:hypothetical protein
VSRNLAPAEQLKGGDPTRASGDGGVENRLSFRRNPHTSFAAASDCRTMAIYEYAP